MTYTTLSGSEITYTPPDGATEVVYMLSIAASTTAQSGVYHVRMMIDGVESGASPTIGGAESRQYGTLETIRFVLDAWSGSKTLKLEVRHHSSNTFLMNIHKRTLTPTGSTTTSNELIKPILNIRAIGTQSTTGQLTSTLTTVTEQGQILETLTGVCDGRTVVVDSGSYTLPNVSSGQEISGDTPDYSDLTGSSITYKPPSGAKQIIYKLRVHAARGDEGGSSWVQFGYKLFIDDVQCGNAKHSDNHNYGDGWHTLTFIIGIGSDDMTNGFIENWNDLKTIKLKVIERESTSTGVALHKSSYNSNFGESDSAVLKPELEITVIGEKTTTNSTGITNRIGTNMSFVHYKELKVLSCTGNTYNEIEGMRLTITPEYNDSVIELKYLIFMQESTKYTRDMGAVVTRTVGGVETIFRNETGGTDLWDTLATTTGHNGYDDHPNSLSMNYYDEPNTTNEVIYKVKIFRTNTSTSNFTVYINRAPASEGGGNAENSTSVASAVEHPKTKTLVQLPLSPNQVNYWKD